eukprot:gene9328-6683_t
MSQRSNKDKGTSLSSSSKMAKVPVPRWEALFIGAEGCGKSLFVRSLKQYYVRKESQLAARMSKVEYNPEEGLQVFLPPTVGVDIVDVTMHVDPTVANPAAVASPPVLSVPSSSSRLNPGRVSPSFSSLRGGGGGGGDAAPADSSTFHSLNGLPSSRTTPALPSFVTIDAQLRELGAAISSRWPSYFSTCQCLVFVCDVADVSQWAATATYLAEIRAYRDSLLEGKPVFLLANRAEDLDAMTLEAACVMMGLRQMQREWPQLTVLFVSALDRHGLEAVAQQLELAALQHPLSGGAAVAAKGDGTS